MMPRCLTALLHRIRPSRKEPKGRFPIDERVWVPYRGQWIQVPASTADQWDDRLWSRHPRG